MASEPRFRAKRMELLKEAVRKAAQIAALWNTKDHGMTLRYREIEKVARLLHSLLLRTDDVVQ